MKRIASIWVAAALLMLALALPAQAQAKAGAAIASQRCAKCHGATGNGDGPDLAKLNVTTAPQSWRSKIGMSKWTDREIIDIITLGGKATGNSPVMPAFHDKLTSEQIDDMLAYIRSLAM
jgi:mono/diheme cytochrome c family protein